MYQYTIAQTKVRKILAGKKPTNKIVSHLLFIQVLTSALVQKVKQCKKNSEQKTTAGSAVCEYHIKKVQDDSVFYNT